jgi:hypothetical protein
LRHPSQIANQINPIQRKPNPESSFERRLIAFALSLRSGLDMLSNLMANISTSSRHGDQPVHPHQRQPQSPPMRPGIERWHGLGNGFGHSSLVAATHKLQAPSTRVAKGVGARCCINRVFA